MRVEVRPVGSRNGRRCGGAHRHPTGSAPLAGEQSLPRQAASSFSNFRAAAVSSPMASAFSQAGFPSVSSDYSKVEPGENANQISVIRSAVILRDARSGNKRT